MMFDYRMVSDHGFYNSFDFGLWVLTLVSGALLAMMVIDHGFRWWLLAMVSDCWCPLWLLIMASDDMFLT